MNSSYITLIIMLIFLAAAGVVKYAFFRKKSMERKQLLIKPFPESWRAILNSRVKFYRDLDDSQKTGFEKRVQLFLATKKITPVDTEIDDTIRIMVASSAIIPMFAFPGYNYPNLREILIYPNSFDENFQTRHFDGHEEFIIGMVGDGYMKGTMIISKPDLVRAYDGVNHKSNVGIHEFVHLIDNIDGANDGIPEILLKHAYAAPWLRVIKEEMSRIEQRRSDISPYALTSNAEFLAVVNEYFFDSPEKFKSRHPELYEYLKGIFHQSP